MISPVIRKLLAVFLLAATLSLGVAAGPVAVFQWVKDKQASIAHLEGRVARLEQVERKAALLGKTLEETDLDQWKGFMVQARTPALAAAEIQSKFSKISDPLGVTALNIQVLPPKREDDFTRVGFRASFRANVYDFLELLEGVEHDPKALLVDNVQIRVVERPDQTLPQVNVTLEVWGLMETDNAEA